MRKARPVAKAKTATKPLLTRPQISILRRAADGEPLMASRTYPHAWNYSIGGTTGKAEKSVPAATIAALCDAGFIDAPRPRLTADSFRYHVTDAGQTFTKNGPPAPDDSQLDWIASA